MSIGLLLGAVVGILPVLLFVVVLQVLDSFKLVRLTVILTMIGAGSTIAAISYFLNSELLTLLQIDFLSYARYVAPPLEEILKAAVLIYLFSRQRIGFHVDAAILGFAVGAGFAVVENFFYLFYYADTNPGIWIVRGFGTAIMHGGGTAIFAIISLVIIETEAVRSWRVYLPGLVLTVLIHSVFNHFFLSPIISTLVVIVLLPMMLYAVFERSANSLHDWLELDFDADTQLLEQLNSGQFEDTHVGTYIKELQQHFDALTIVDMLCFLRIYTELSMRAKGAMMMRKHGMEMPHDPEVEASFVELKYLERSIGRTGMLTLEPFLEMDRRDLWHLNALEAQTQ